MRTRSKRLFIVLLHLVGVSTNLPRRHGSHVGIVGVHPMAILLERLDLERTNGLDGLLDDEHILDDPYWLQDDVDGKCYGPGGGFSECGDATLWQLKRKTTIQQQRGGLLSKLFSPENYSKEGFALQLVNLEMMLHEKSGDNHNNKRRRPETDCLVAERRKRKSKSGTMLGLGDCLSSCSWRINDKGVLYQQVEERNNAKGMHMGQPPIVFQGQHVPTRCLWRLNATSAVLSPCNAEPTTEAEVLDRGRRLVSFSLVRYQTASYTSSSESMRHHTTTITPGGSILPTKDPTIEDETEERELITDHVQTTKDMAHSHATGLAMHPELKPPQQLLFPRLGELHSGGSTVSSSSPLKKKRPAPPVALLKDSNPILFHIQDGNQDTDIRASSEIIDGDERVSPRSSAIGGSGRDGGVSSIGRLRRIQMHPYIAACKKEVWTDPQTGLEYLTDISGYLGHERKASGRHTLMGVGQYTRTVFNIKVYGVAFYVSKRDVLADPLFESYATMTADELRLTPSFYSHLRNMPSPLDSNAGLFDRTIFLKLNMQISTENMRASLQADWKKLTDDHKRRLINSSLNPRSALEPMLQKIQSDDNPSRCSCGQVAPEEYDADRSCCARGTELVFTWRKSGDLELRLDGRIMDVFSSPEMAKGIFYEYLRMDDPISPDAIHRIPDGFPFLLAPLVQVKGVSSPAMSVASSDSVSSQDLNDNGVFRAMGNLAVMVSSQTSGFAGWVQSSANGMASNVVNAARSTGDSMRSLGDEMEKRRTQLWTQMASMPEQSRQFLSARMQDVAYNVRARKYRHKSLVLVSTERESSSGLTSPSRSAPSRGRLFRSAMSRWLGEELPLPDEIGPVIEPTMNMTRKLFLFMVHLYLLLLLIVSMPGSYTTTRTRLRAARKSCCTTSSKASSADLEDIYSILSSSDEEEGLDHGRGVGPANSPLMKSVERASAPRRSRKDLKQLTSQAHEVKPTQEMKKSLSYFL